MQANDVEDVPRALHSLVVEPLQLSGGLFRGNGLDPSHASAPLRKAAPILAESREARIDVILFWRRRAGHPNSSRGEVLEWPNRAAC